MLVGAVGITNLQTLCYMEKKKTRKKERKHTEMKHMTFYRTLSLQKYIYEQRIGGSKKKRTANRKNSHVVIEQTE